MNQENKNKFGIDMSFYADSVEETKEHPFAQILNKENDHGLFIQTLQAKKAGFSDEFLNETDKYVLKTLSNEKIEGYLLKSANFVVLRETPLLMSVLENEASRYAKLCQYDNDFYSANKGLKYQNFKGEEKPKVQVFKKWLIVLHDKNNQPLHEMPLQLSLKGGAGVRIGKEGYDLAKREFNKAMIDAGVFKHGTVAKDNLTALLLFKPTFGAELVGAGNKKSYGCVITSWKKINEDNILDFFLNADEAHRDYLLALYQETQYFMEYPTVQELLNLAADEADGEDGYFGERGFRGDTPPLSRKTKSDMERIAEINVRLQQAEDDRDGKETQLIDEIPF